MIWTDIQILVSRFRYFLTLSDRDTVRDWDLSDRVEAAQHSMRLTAFGVGMLAFLAGFGVCWLVFFR